eukprot:8416565-Ditylum_brightwellii.AAC.1
MMRYNHCMGHWLNLVIEFISKYIPEVEDALSIVQLLYMTVFALPEQVASFEARQKNRLKNGNIFIDVDKNIESYRESDDKEEEKDENLNVREIVDFLLGKKPRRLKRLTKLSETHWSCRVFGTSKVRDLFASLFEEVKVTANDQNATGKQHMEAQ